MQNNGFVTFVGAGAGGLDLLTIGAFKAIKAATAILYDALIDEEIIAILPIKCLKICVGKRAGSHSVSQNKTNEILVKLAQKGHNIVRLKGGDISIFGRIGEEREYLNQNAIPHSSIAGITAASAAAAQFEIPLTHRSVSRSVSFITGTTNEGCADFDINELGKTDRTIVFYMSSKNAQKIMENCLNAGRDKQTPICAIENAGTERAKINSGTLGELSQLVQNLYATGPVLLILGEVVALAKINQICCNQKIHSWA